MSKIYMLGICGPKGSGKSTAAKILFDKFGFERHRFAGPLKNALKVAFGLTDDHVDGHLKEEPTELLNGQTPRHAMMTMGTEWGRNMIHKDIWITAWRNTMPKASRVCVDDIRFPNEIEMLRRDYKASVIRLTRPGHEHVGTHESEAHGELQADYVVHNDGDVELLAERIAEIVKSDVDFRIKNGQKINLSENLSL